MVKNIVQHLMLVVSVFCIFCYKQELSFKMHGSHADHSFMFCFLMKSFSHFHYVNIYEELCAIKAEPKCCVFLK